MAEDRDGTYVRLDKNGETIVTRWLMVVFIHSMFPTANGIITMIMSQVVFYFGKPNTSSIEMHRIESISAILK